jgi:hypothetical protein
MGEANVREGRLHVKASEIKVERAMDETKKIRCARADRSIGNHHEEESNEGSEE